MLGSVEGMIINSGQKIPRNRAEKDERDTWNQNDDGSRNEAPPIDFRGMTSSAQ